MAISGILQFEAVLSDVRHLMDKISYSAYQSGKFEEARRVFHEVVRTLRSKQPMTKLQTSRFLKACEVLVTEYGSNQPLLEKLMDMQDYLELNPPAG